MAAEILFCPSLLNFVSFENLRSFDLYMHTKAPHHVQSRHPLKRPHRGQMSIADYRLLCDPVGVEHRKHMLAIIIRNLRLL